MNRILSFKIANKEDKDNCYSEFQRTIENMIFTELIDKQHHYLNVKIEISASDEE